MHIRPLTTVTYVLDLITNSGELREVYNISYDSEFYDEDIESTDSIFINMRLADLKEKHGDDTFMLEFSVERKKQIIN